MKKQILTLILISLFSFHANALFEVRAGYGINTPADDSAELEGGGTVSLGTMAGFNLDFIVSPPMLPFGFGLRYESMGMDVETSGLSYNTDLERIAAIINYRLIDTLIFVGVIGTVGVSNEASVDFSGVSTVDYDADLTYSIGAEAGASLGLLFVGAELGYLVAEYEAKNASLSNLDEFDASGIYGKAFVGFGF